MTPICDYKKFTVLYVEDESIIRSNVESCLKYVFNVIVAKNGEEGVRLFNNNKIDLIITDISMPEKNGIEMLKEIKLKKPLIPCIITSAYDMDLIEIDHNFYNRFIPKPFDVKDLLDNTIDVLETKCVS